MMCGEPSTGSESDLERATDTARDMAGRFGMSSRLGRVRVLHHDREVFLGRDYLSTRDVSQPTLEQLDAEVRRILDEQEEVARRILSTHRRVLDSLASSLVTHETLQGAALEEALRDVAVSAGNGAVSSAGSHAGSTGWPNGASS
jgi:cell division protease FtsH